MFSSSYEAHIIKTRFISFCSVPWWLKFIRGSGNYSSDEQKEIARLKRELRDAQDALDVLKKAISILGK